MTLHVCTLLWDASLRTRRFSRCYSELWVERLYRGFARNLTMPFRFVCFTDRDRSFDAPVKQERIRAKRPDYSTCIEPYRLGAPMILVGLDTVVTGNIDHLADYCLTADRLALPRDPYRKKIACNGVALVPEGHERIAVEHNGENDMAWVRRFPHRLMDDLWPGHVVSFKGHVMQHGLGEARIVYFHGEPKMHRLSEPWLLKHWRDDI